MTSLLATLLATRRLGVTILSALIITAAACTEDEDPLRLRIYDPKGVAKVEVTTADIARRSARMHRVGSTAAISFRLTNAGAKRSHVLTRALARRGAHSGQRQRFFLAIDGRIYARIWIGYDAFPNGFDGRSGIQIEGVDPSTARDIVRRIRQMESSAP